MLAGPRPKLDAVDLAFTRAAVRNALFEESKTGPLIGRFEIQGRLGVGGMGRVYRAHDPQLDRTVAVKLILADSEDADAEDHETQRERLVQEARALAKLAHPNVVAVFESGVSGGDVYLAMEHVPGQNLRVWADSPRDWRETLEVLLQAGRGLAAAHDAGIIHRDFKPENVLVGEDGRVRVADFGLARPRASPRERVADAVTIGPGRSFDFASLTRTGARVGTPAYLAPEVWEGAVADARSDQYSYCVTAHEALCGHRPAEGKPSEPPDGMPRSVFDAIGRGLAPEAKDRHESLQVLLDQLSDPPARHAARPWWALAIVTVLAGAAGIGYGSLRDQASGDAAAPDPCGDFERELEGVWDDDARAGLEAAFVDENRPYLAAVAEAARARLDLYAKQWVQARSETCRATRVRGEQSEPVDGLRTTCLERRRVEFGRTVELLTEAKAEQLERAPTVVAELTPIAVCAEIEMLTRRRPQLDDAAQATLARGEDHLLEAGTLLHAAQYEQSLEQAKLASAAAAELDLQSLRARALLIQGAAEVGLELSSAERTLRDAVWAAEAAREDETAAEAWIRIARLIGDEKGDAQGVAEELERASAAVARTDSDRHRGQLLRLRAQIDVRAGRFEDALQSLEEARPFYERSLPNDHPDRASLLQTMGNTYFRLARYDDAERAFADAVELKERAYGRGHPKVTQLIANQGTTMVAQGRYEDSIPVFEEALALSREAAGPDHQPKGVGDLLNSLGAAHDQLGHQDEALRLYRQALAAFEAVQDGNHPSILAARTNIARVLGRLERFTEAEAELQRVLQARIESQGALHSAVAEPLTSLGTLALAQDDAARSAQFHQRALAIREQSLGHEHVHTGLSHHNLGEALEGLGRHDEARRQARQAIRILAANSSANPTYLALAHLALARDELALKKHSAAEKAAASALEVLDKGSDGDHARARFVYAQALASRDPARAQDQAQQARATLEGKCDSAGELCDRIDRWLAGP